MSVNYSFRSNVAKNRLYVTIKGTITLAEVDTYSDAFMKEVYKLKPGGSTIVFDMREATALEPAAAAKLEANKVKCIEHGMKKFAFLVASVVLKGQMKRSYSGNEMDAYFDNIEEAEKFLDM